MSLWSPELELIARLSRIQPNSQDLERADVLAKGPLDWERFLALAAYHGVAPLVDANLPDIEASTWPDGFSERIRGVRLSSTRSDLANYVCWLELCKAFEERGIRAVTLKGFQVVLAIYGDLGRRPVGDLDFLVERDSVAPALDILETMGYSLWPVWRTALRHVGLDHVLDSTYQVALSSERGIVIDLHWEPGPPRMAPSAHRVLARAETMPIGDQEVLVPSGGDALALLLLHGHKSAWGRLRWLVDVVESLERLTSIQYDGLILELDDLGMRSALHNALSLMDSLWGRLPNPGFDLSYSTSDGQPRRVAYYRKVIERDWDVAQSHGPWRAVRMLRIRAGREPSLWAAIVSASRPNYNDWAFVALPRVLRVGYLAVRPLRVVREALGAGMRRIAKWRAARRFDQPWSPSPVKVTSGWDGDPLGLPAEDRAKPPVDHPAVPRARAASGKKDIRIYLPGHHDLDWFPKFSRALCEDFIEPHFNVAYAEPVADDQSHRTYEIGDRRCRVHPYVVAFEAPTSGRLRLLTTVDHPGDIFRQWNFDLDLVDRVYTGQYLRPRLEENMETLWRELEISGSEDDFDRLWQRWIYRPLFWGMVEKVLDEPPPGRKPDLFFRGLHSPGRAALEHLSSHARPDDRLDIQWWGPTEKKGSLQPLEYLRELRAHDVALSLPGVGEICNRDIECFGLGVPVLRPVFTGELAYPLEAGVHYIGVPYEPLGHMDGGRMPDYPKDPAQLAQDLLDEYRRVRDDQDLLGGVAARAAEYYEKYCAYPASGQITFDLLDLDSL